MMQILTRALKPLTLGMLLAACCCGCGDKSMLDGMLDRFIPGRQAHSDRTKHAYSPNPLVISEQDRQLQDYLNRLESINPSNSTTGAYRPRRVHIPILPNDMNPAMMDAQSGPFSPNAKVRDISPPPNLRTGEGPTPGRITPISPIIEPSTTPPPVSGVVEQASTTPGTPGTNGGGKKLFSPEDQLSDGDFDELVRPYRQMVEADPDNLDKHLQLKLLLAAAGLREQALEPIAILDESENQRLKDLLLMIMSLRDRPQLAPTPQEAAEQVEALERLTQKLQSLADLRIPRMAICRSVNSYGNYQKFEKYEFQPGQLMVVYCEVKNFSIEDKGGGRYSTILDLELGLYNNLGALVRPIKKTSGIEDISANRRNDFFLTDFYAIPSDIPAGEYTLKAIIRDPRVNKVATASIDIKVTASEPVAQ